MYAYYGAAYLHDGGGGVDDGEVDDDVDDNDDNDELNIFDCRLAWRRGASPSTRRGSS